MSRTEQQIKALREYEKQTAASRRGHIIRTVENAIVQAKAGDNYPLKMLYRIANMEMNGASAAQADLKETLRVYVPLICVPEEYR